MERPAFGVLHEVSILLPRIRCLSSQVCNIWARLDPMGFWDKHIRIRCSQVPTWNTHREVYPRDHWYSYPDWHRLAHCGSSLQLPCAYMSCNGDLEQQDW